MILRVDAATAVPVYEQIREQVIRMVVAGTLTPGTRLPTIRQLANDLQVAKGTVAKAYSLLQEAGVIDTQGRRGTFVLPIPVVAGLVDSTIEGQLAEAADAYVVAARQLGVDVDVATETLARRWLHL